MHSLRDAPLPPSPLPPLPGQAPMERFHVYCAHRKLSGRGWEDVIVTGDIEAAVAHAQEAGNTADMEAAVVDCWTGRLVWATWEGDE